MEPVDALVDLETAATLAGLSTSDFRRIVEAHAIAMRDDGLRCLASDVAAWHEHDRATRRAALVRLARAIGDEVFY